MRRRWLRLTAKTLGLVMVVLAILTVRVAIESEGELQRADRLRGEGRLDLAIVHYRRAAGWHAPANPYEVSALEALFHIAETAESHHDIPLALSAYRGVRGAILSARSVYTPHRDQLDRANQRISELMAMEPPAPIDAKKSRAELRGELLAQLREDSRPSLLALAMVFIGLIAWITAVFLFGQRGLDEEDRWVPREALRWGTVFVIGFGLFVLGMAI